MNIFFYSEEHYAVGKFRRYLQIKSVQPDPDYSSCVEFLTEYAEELGLELTVVDVVPGIHFF